MQKINISHLVVNGDSFTYGDGLEQPSVQAWPILLANRLGVPVANIALGGTSNDRIYRKTVDYIFADTGSDPFYIIGMTSCTRREEYCRSVQEYFPLHILDYSGNLWNSWAKKIEKLLLSETDPAVLAKRKVDIWLSIINLFKATETNYLIADMIPTAYAEVQHINSKLYNYVGNDTNHLSDYQKVVSCLGKLPCGHYDADAQVAIANYMYKKLISRYDITLTDPKHLKIKDFYTPAEIALATRKNKTDWIR
jgi:hypothetical protein